MVALKLRFGTGQKLDMFPVFGQMFCRCPFIWDDSYMNSIFLELLTRKCLKACTHFLRT
jgi:hypothetical protein